jgi:hypothetical protein
LHQLRNSLQSKIELPSDNSDKWSQIGQIVAAQVPKWLYRETDDYCRSLSALTVPQLYNIATSLNLTTLRRKQNLIEVVVNDFCDQRSRLWDVVKCSNQPCMVSVSRHFHDRYRPSIFRALSDIRTQNQFRPVNEFAAATTECGVTTNLCASEDTGCNDLWLNLSYDEMDRRLRQ